MLYFCSVTAKNNNWTVKLLHGKVLILTRTRCIGLIVFQVFVKTAKHSSDSIWFSLTNDTVVFRVPSKAGKFHLCIFGPAFSSRPYCIFGPSNLTYLVPHFPVLHFPVPHFQSPNEFFLVHGYINFHKDPISSFYVRLLTERQTISRSWSGTSRKLGQGQRS